jgi:hypothetical protein
MMCTCTFGFWLFSSQIIEFENCLPRYFPSVIWYETGNQWYQAESDGVLKRKPSEEWEEQHWK